MTTSEMGAREVDLNREAWLTELAARVEPVFRGFRLPRYRLTCGWPCRRGGSRGKRQVVGECHRPQNSKAGVMEIFISPLLESSLEVAGTACHEMAHVAAGIEAQHGAKFVEVCRHVGLTKGKPTHVMPGERLENRLRQVIAVIGQEYPHAAMVLEMKRRAAKGVGGVKLECACGVNFRMARRWFDLSGAPTCGCGRPMLTEEEREDQGGNDDE